MHFVTELLCKIKQRPGLHTLLVQDFYFIRSSARETLHVNKVCMPANYLCELCGDNDSEIKVHV